MKDKFIIYRQTTQVMQVGLTRLLLTLLLASASLPAFSARNSAQFNSAPVISGTPATSVVANNSYYFQPTATDANRDRLKFTISNKPAWASFSRKTGRLSGTPMAANVGSYSNIVISVSDRKTSTNLPAFTIRVDATGATSSNSINTTSNTPVQTGSLTLQWSAPVTRVDGTSLSLSEIDGYRIYYGVSTGNYPSRIDIADGTTQSVTITDMPVGTYYLVMTTYDVSGLESTYSSMVTKYAK